MMKISGKWKINHIDTTQTRLGLDLDANILNIIIPSSCECQGD